MVIMFAFWRLLREGLGTQLFCFGRMRSLGQAEEKRVAGYRERGHVRTSAQQIVGFCRTLEWLPKLPRALALYGLQVGLQPIFVDRKGLM